MKHQDPEKLLSDAQALPCEPAVESMSRVDRLRKWADALQAHQGHLNALQQIEYLPFRERRAYHGPNTPLTVAYNDPDLRAAGLAGETLGDIMDFFEMTNEDAHRLLCDCHYQGTMTGGGLAYRIRDYARRVERGTLWERAQGVFFGHG